MYSMAETYHDTDGYAIPIHLRYPGQLYEPETGLYYWGARYYDPKTGRGISADRMSVAEHVQRWQANLGSPNHLPLELNPYTYVANNPLRWIDPTGFTLQNNWNFFWDWALERGPSQRFYGPETIETQEMMNSPGAQQMRENFRAGGCKNIPILGYSTEDAYLQTALDPSSTAFQVGGFIYSATNSGNGMATYRIYNRASMYSFFYHLPGVPYKSRGGSLPFMGNIDQKFEWSEQCGCQK